mmetsp:Transcript_2569/g.6817  ORF Transcript_2569/g.6817 Transcript_2569/m.6817 type:complete len:208 (-) Transcript_2569:166-789(-)
MPLITPKMVLLWTLAFSMGRCLWTSITATTCSERLPLPTTIEARMRTCVPFKSGTGKNNTGLPPFDRRHWFSGTMKPRAANAPNASVPAPSDWPHTSKPLPTNRTTCSARMSLSFWLPRNSPRRKDRGRTRNKPTDTLCPRREPSSLCRPEPAFSMRFASATFPLRPETTRSATRTISSFAMGHPQASTRSCKTAMSSASPPLLLPA